MVKLDLNIEVAEEVREKVEDGVDEKGNPKTKEVLITPPELAIRWIVIMLERSINKPKTDTRTGRMMPTVQVTMEVQRKYSKVLGELERNVVGIAELEDDDFSFLQRKWDQAEMSLQADINKILIEVDNKILQAAAARGGKEK